MPRKKGYKKKKKKLGLLKKGFPYAKKYGSLAYQRSRVLLPEVETEIQTGSKALAKRIVKLAEVV